MSFLSKTNVSIFISLSAIYFIYYFAQGAIPGNYTHPLGWWGWFDQGHYLTAVRAVYEGDFASNNFFYPPGYFFVGAIFYAYFPVHPFIFINLFCFVGFGFSYIYLAKDYVGKNAASLSFVALCLLVPTFTAQFVIPWTTTPVAFLLSFSMLLIIKIIKDDKQEVLFYALVGFLAGLITLFRPGDILFLTIPLLFGLYHLIVQALSQPYRKFYFFANRFCIFTFAMLLGVALFFLFNYLVHGDVLGNYFSTATANGFALGDIGEKTVSLLFDPQPLYLEKESSFFNYYPWMFLSLIGVILSFIKKSTYLIIILLAILTNVFIYFPYADLLPTGMWRFLNIHYFVWFFPFLVLFALLPFFWFNSISVKQWGMVILVALFLVSPGIQTSIVDDYKVSSEKGEYLNLSFSKPTEIDGIKLLGSVGAWTDTYFKSASISLDGKEVDFVKDYRFIPGKGLTQLIFTRPVTITNVTIKFDNIEPLKPYIGVLPFYTGYQFLKYPWLLSQDSVSYNLYKIGERISFKSGDNSTLYSLSGWSGQESWGTWTDGSNAKLGFELLSEPQGICLLSFNAASFPSQSGQQLKVRIRVNKQSIGDDILFTNGSFQEYSIVIPQGNIEKGANQVVFSLFEPVSPQSIGLSQDTRELGVGVEWIELTCDGY